MEDDKKFVHYLIVDYRSAKTGVPYSPKVASNIKSRCKRIEIILETELTIALVSNTNKFMQLADQIKSKTGHFCSTTHPYGYLQYIHALRAYRLFASQVARGKTSNSKANND